MIYPAAFEAPATILQSVRESCVDKSTADYCSPVKSGLQLDESELSRSARETYEYILSTSHVAISCASILGFLEPGQKTNLMTRYQEFQIINISLAYAKRPCASLPPPLRPCKVERHSHNLWRVILTFFQKTNSAGQMLAVL
jgi:hypothetical protein